MVTFTTIRGSVSLGAPRSDPSIWPRGLHPGLCIQGTEEAVVSTPPRGPHLVQQSKPSMWFCSSSRKFSKPGGQFCFQKTSLRFQLDTDALKIHRHERRGLSTQ